MRNVSGRICRENQNAFSVQKRIPENRAVYEIIWKNKIDPDRPHMTIRHMHIACWRHKATNAHSEYITLIAFRYQQWLHEPRDLN